MDILQDTVFIDRVKNIDWFSNVGNELKRPSSFEIEYIKTWKQARVSYLQDSWQESKTAARDAFTGVLKHDHPDEFPFWDGLLRQARMFSQQEFQHIWETIQVDNRLDNKFVTDVRNSIFYAFVEKAYQNVVMKQGFFLRILSVFESGNYPCGWKGSWPQGKLVVF